MTCKTLSSVLQLRSFMCIFSPSSRCLWPAFPALFICSDVVEALLRNEALTNVADSKGCYPLHLAAWKGDERIVKLLIHKGPSHPKINEQVCCCIYFSILMWTSLLKLWFFIFKDVLKKSSTMCHWYSTDVKELHHVVCFTPKQVFAILWFNSSISLEAHNKNKKNLLTLS